MGEVGVNAICFMGSMLIKDIKLFDQVEHLYRPSDILREITFTTPPAKLWLFIKMNNTYEWLNLNIINKFKSYAKRRKASLIKERKAKKVYRDQIIKTN